MVDVKNKLRLKKIKYRGATLVVNTNWREGIGHRCTVQGRQGCHGDGATVEEAVENCISIWLK